MKRLMRLASKLQTKKRKINKNLAKIEDLKEEIKIIKSQNQYLEVQISTLLYHFKGHEEALKVKVEYSEQLSLSLTPIESLLAHP